MRIVLCKEYQETVEEFQRNAFTKLDDAARKSLLSDITETLRKVLLYPENSIIYIMISLSPQKIMVINTDIDGQRKSFAKFFGMNEPVAKQV
ncbi:hypothetical protein Y032_0012g1646 [Ancylostoma ceylanicum]|uniref:Uncharacterized protein n=1 Tax=Ancylostoma ceylanicum TaxID=53326 RepID=A0A016VCP3_9BILA|nr:hypothetical protein Y032_0012g1646 [Ancylostoma ceylanicum]